MILPTPDERQNATEKPSAPSHLERKKALLNEARADALRANLKKRKEQTNGRRIEIEQEETNI